MVTTTLLALLLASPAQVSPIPPSDGSGAVPVPGQPAEPAPVQGARADATPADATPGSTTLASATQADTTQAAPGRPGPARTQEPDTRAARPAEAGHPDADDVPRVERRLVALRGVRDLDGDRVPDLCLRTVRGSAASELVAISSATGEALWVAAPPEGFHERTPEPPIDAIAPLGDLDADGAGEVAVVWRRTDDVSDAQQHVVAFHAGHDGRILRVLRLGREAERARGVSLVQTADLDGDLQPDVLVVAPRGDVRPGELSAFSAATGEELWRARTGAVRTDNGASVVALRDADGDGVADVAALELDGVAVLSGRDGRPIRRIGADALELVREGGARWALGTSLTTASDLDGDRIPEVALLARAAPGEATELVLVSPGKGTVVLRVPMAVRSCEVYAAGLRSLGDADGDGRPEILLCDPCANLPGVPVLAGADAGAVRVLSGRDGFLQRAWDGGPTSMWLGAFATPAGDVDRDGVPDVWMSTSEMVGRLGQAVWLASGRTGEIVRWVELASVRVEPTH